MAAARNHLTLLNVAKDFLSKDSSITATTVFSRHLWYLSETLVGFAFFDDLATLKSEEEAGEKPERQAGT